MKKLIALVLTVLMLSAMALSVCAGGDEPAAPRFNSSLVLNTLWRKYQIQNVVVGEGVTTTSAKIAATGDVITVATAPAEGWKLAKLKVVDALGREVEVKAAGEGVYTFVMPAVKATVSTTYKEFTTIELGQSGLTVEVEGCFVLDMENAFEDVEEVIEEAEAELDEAVAIVEEAEAEEVVIEEEAVAELEEAVAELEEAVAELVEVAEELDDDDYMIAYYINKETNMDFDVYEWAKEEGVTLEDAVLEESEEYELTEFGGYAVAVYTSEDEFEGVVYDTVTYIIDAGEYFEEIVFYLDVEGAAAVAEAMMATLA